VTHSDGVTRLVRCLATRRKARFGESRFRRFQAYLSFEEFRSRSQACYLATISTVTIWLRKTYVIQHLLYLQLRNIKILNPLQMFIRIIQEIKTRQFALSKQVQIQALK